MENRDSWINNAEPIAIVGIGCRLPGGVNSPSQLWDLLREERSGWSEFTSNQFNVDAFYHPNSQRPGSVVSRGGYVLNEDVRQFDNALFGISPSETRALDPAQRKLLEVTYEAFESAGEPWNRFSGSRTGVFVGNFNHDHQLMQHRDSDHTLPYAATGGGVTILSNRISYVFNLQGPSLVVDTACSASMYALHLAVTSIRNGDCDAAVVAGSNLILGPDAQILTTKLGALSPTSQCHTFDAAADGYARAEAVGALYLKKLSQATTSGDPIRAIVRATAFNANGKTGGISHPSPNGQEAVIRQAYKVAGNLDPTLTGYFECHGTGTPAGDPIEVAAVGKVFSPGRLDDEPLLIGSVKTNLGHSEAASAMSQVMKAILAMEYGEIPATIGLKKLNPAIDFNTARVRVVTEMTPWPKDKMRRVSINSFGYGGANAHCILDHPSTVIPGYTLPGLRLSRQSLPPPLCINGDANGHINGHTNGFPNGHVNGFFADRVQNLEQAATHPRCWHKRSQLIQTREAGTRGLILLAISAHDEISLKENFTTVAESLSDFELADILYTLGSRRSQFTRRAFVVADADSLRNNTELRVDSLIYGKSPGSAVKRVGFVFTGQGAQWPQMGSKLLAEYSVCRNVILYLDSILGQLSRKPAWTIEEVLLEPEATSRIHEPKVSQTVCTALQIAITSLLRSWGIDPAATVGHSSGEIAAAFAAGHLRASEAIVLAYCRGQAVSANRQEGRMLAVGLGPEAVASYLDGVENDVKIAAVNSSDSVTLSGEVDAIMNLSSRMDANNVFNRLLKTGGNAYHSHHMAALGETYQDLANQALEEISRFETVDELSEPLPVRWVSSVTPEKKVPRADSRYWRKNLESPVLFAHAAHVLAREASVDLLVEVGPHPALSGPLKQIRTSLDEQGLKLPQCLASLRRNENDNVSMLTLAGNLFLSNASIDLVAVNATEKEDGLAHGFLCIDMPSYRYHYDEKANFFENRISKEFRARKFPRHDLLGSRQPGSSRVRPSWRNMLRMKDLPWLDDHKLVPHAVLPAAAFISMAVEAARQMEHEDQEADNHAGPIQAFKLRNVNISSTLHVVDDEIGVETVLDMEKLQSSGTNIKTKWSRFSISSMVPGSNIWTEHCTGVICPETTSPKMGDKLVTDKRSRSLDITRWYDKFAQVGLGYGPTFQGLSELQAFWGCNVAAARVAVNPTSGTVKGGESFYPLHPAALDTCLQLALIACHAGQVENVTKAFVPIAAGNITVWVNGIVSSEERGLGVSSAEAVGMRSVQARTQLHSPSGAPLLDIDELRLVAYNDNFSGISSTHNLSSREPFWRSVSRVDIDSLTDKSAKAMFPSQHAPERTLELFDCFCAFTIDSLELLGNHDVNNSEAVQWIRAARESFLLRKASLHGDQPAKLFDDISTKLGDIAEIKCIRHLYNHCQSEILRGESTGAELLKENKLLHELYSSGISVHKAYTQLRRTVDLLAHKNPRLKILELGGGTGGATRVVLNVLASNTSSKRFQTYTFTDSKSWCLENARRLFADYGGISCHVLDIEQDPSSLGFESQSFDLIIASGCFYQTRNLKLALDNARSLLRPNGRMLILELTRPRLGFDLLFRTLTGRWDESRSLFMDQEEWDGALVRSGFSGVDIALDDYSGNQAISSVMLTTAIEQQRFQQKPVPRSTTNAYLVYRSYPPPLARAIEKELEKQGTHVIYRDLLQPTDDISSGAKIIMLVDLETVTLTKCDARHFQAMQATILRAASLVWVATGDLFNGSHPELAIMKGLLRSISTENVLLKAILFGLEPTFHSSLAETARIISDRALSIFDNSGNEILEQEYTMHNGYLYIDRLLPDKSLNKQFRVRHRLETEIHERPMNSLGPLRASYKQPGVLSSLFFEEDATFSKPLPADWVEIETRAMGLNVKDLAVAVGRFDWEFLSSEISGVVSKVGTAVATLTAGDPVFGAVPGNMGNYTRSPASLVQKLSPGESFVDAASMPISYLTAIYAIRHIARLSEGETILIQSATGGLGMAAIRIAKHIGARIYATVGNDKKKDVLINEFGLAAKDIFNLRNLDAVDELMQATNNNGIDVILSSTVGDIMRETWRCIAPLGRFIDVGRRDVLAAGQLSLEVFKRNATFSSFDLGLINRQKPQVVSKLMQELRHLWNDGIIGPIEHTTTFDISQLEAAMGYFSKGVHTGKVVINFDHPDIKLNIAQIPTRVSFDPNAAYLLVGCLGGLGRSLATWMVDRGARHLVFMSRSGADKPEAAALVQELGDKGAEPEVLCCSSTNRDAVVSAIEQISKLRPLKGVIHSAMVQGDTFFEKARYSQIQDVLAPKVTGTANLHDATAHLPLSFFLMVSSIVASIGTASQSAYCAANAFQDAFARFRRAHSLPATSLALPVVLEIGAVREISTFQQMLLRNTSYGISETEFLQLLEGALCSHSELEPDPLLSEDPFFDAQLLVGLEPSRLVSYAKTSRMSDLIWQTDARFQAVVQAVSDRVHATAADPTRSSSSSRELLRAAGSRAEAATIALTAVVGRVAELLGLHVDDIDSEQPMLRYGIDSITAAELRNWLMKTFEVEVTVLQLLSNTVRVEDLAGLIVESTKNK